MDIKILDSWLREFLTTNATPNKISEYLSLCGPSVERIEKFGNDSVYDIEVTTNRVDSASVYGIAREAAAILPRFGVKANLKRIKSESNEYNFTKGVDYIDATIDKKLCERFTAVLIKNVTIADSPEWLKTRLESAGVRAINNVVDISNYIMLELGQPVHTFDYEKIKGAKMLLRESKKDEKITTLDGKEFNLDGGDIIIEDGDGRLIDLAGIMGGNLSAVDKTTKNVLLFVQTYNPVPIRRTSMQLAQRTTAATIFEKGTDPELVAPGILSAIELFKTICKGTPEKEILDIYGEPYKPAKIKVKSEFIEKRLGIAIPKKDISEYLNSLDFETVWKGNTLEVVVPSFRAKDVLNSEDVVEEIARIYGYHNLPSKIMDGEIPARPGNPEFAFESKVKNALSGWGGVEVYTLSLVSNVAGAYGGASALKLKNPLGSDSEYLRTSLMPSLAAAAKENIGTFEKFHLFEMANVYLPKAKDLPEEKLMLAGIFSGYKYREAKGTVEALLQKLNIDIEFIAQDKNGFSASHVASIKSQGKEIGLVGVTDNNLTYYEFEVGKLMESSSPPKFQEISKYPSQKEDLTLTFPEKTKIGDVISAIKASSQLINKVELVDTFKGSSTIHVEYHDEDKTLTNEDVEKVRSQILTSVKSKFGGTLKD